VTVHEHHQCWNRANRKAGGEGRLFFRIHFGQAKRGLELPGCTGERRRHASAGAAPGRPEVDYDRQFGAADMLIEGRRRQDGWRTVKKRRLAMTTAPLVTQARFRHPVWTMATRADNYSRCIHDDKRRFRRLFSITLNRNLGTLIAGRVAFPDGPQVYPRGPHSRLLRWLQVRSSTSAR